MNKSCPNPFDSPLNRADLLRTIWLTRPDLRALVGDDRNLFELWCLLNGPREYRGLADCPADFPRERLSAPAPIADPRTDPPLTRLMHDLWRLRPDLQARYDLSDPTQQQAFVWWYFLTGVAELALHDLVTESQRQWLNSPAPDLAGGTFLPVTRLMRQVWTQRADLRAAFDPRTPAGAEALLNWYFHRGLIEYPLAGYLDETQMRVLMAPHPQAPAIPRVLKLLHDAEPALSARFPDPTAAAFRHWASGDEGQRQFPVLKHLMTLIGWPSHKPIRPRAASGQPFGVNLIGYARGQLGIGEDVRMAALACQAAGIPFAVHNVEPGRDVDQGDASLNDRIRDDLPYAINLFCVTGIETASLAALQGARLFDGRRSIGYWPWELPEWPADWYHAYGLVDEVWASSRFAYNAYIASSSKPVRHLPMAVEVTPTAHKTRQDFGLPPGDFLFIFSFDFLSSVARKNPQACVTAFRRAFPRGDEPVGLVVKAMRASAENPLWQALLTAAQADPRIRIIARTLDRAELLDLYRACDCYVSLHRSEGFGRGLAEAMLLGKPVIATGYSGNLDFTVPGTAALVDHRFVTLGADDYPFGARQQWAEPDIGHAAQWMRQLATDVLMRHTLSRQGQLLAANTYAPAVVGKRYAQALKRLVNAASG